MKITNRELLNKIRVLESTAEKQLGVKVSYIIAKNIKNINKELELFNEEKIKIINKYSEKDEQGNPKINNNNFILVKGKEDLVNKEYNELLDIEIEIDIKKFNINEIDSEAKFTPNELIELDFMII